MILKIVIYALTCLVIGFSAHSQSPCSETNLRDLVARIDHVPIVVSDLKETKSLLTKILQFTVKDGREHEGIRNVFIKFQDGTYLEFTTPTDSTFVIGNYYTNFLERRPGGTILALSVKSADSLATVLQQCNISYKETSNPVWRSIEPLASNLFFIEYTNKSWRDSEMNTTHANQSLSLQSVWWISSSPEKDIFNFSKLGFSYMGTERHLGIQTRVLRAHSSKLIVIDQNEGANLAPNYKVSQSEGVFGFTIQVKSLSETKQLLNIKDLVEINDSLVYFVNQYNFFMEFIE